MKITITRFAQKDYGGHTVEVADDELVGLYKRLLATHQEAAVDALEALKPIIASLTTPFIVPSDPDKSH